MNQPIAIALPFPPRRVASLPGRKGYMQTDEVYTVQHGSDNTLHVTDENRFYVVRQTWEGTRLLDSKIVASYNTAEEAKRKRHALNLSL